MNDCFTEYHCSLIKESPLITHCLVQPRFPTDSVTCALILQGLVALVLILSGHCMAVQDSNFNSIYD